MTTNSTQDKSEWLQAQQRNFAVIRRVEAGDVTGDATIIAFKRYRDVVVSLTDTGELWLNNNVEAERAFREARILAADDTAAVYRFLSGAAMVELCKRVSSEAQH